MNDQYDQLISLVRRLVDGECRGQGVLERGRSNAALAAWLREHDTREEVEAVEETLAQKAAELLLAKPEPDLLLAWADKKAQPKSVRAVEAESRQARELLGTAQLSTDGEPNQKMRDMLKKTAERRHGLGKLRAEVCADCGGPIGESGPPDGWQLEDGRTVCQTCAVKDTARYYQSRQARKETGE